MKKFSYGIFLFCSIMFLVINCVAQDTLTLGQSIRDGDIPETLVSSGGRFELGFFNPGVNGRKYVGIWFKNIPTTVVWVANREAPLLDSSGVLQVTNNSVLVLFNGTGDVLWSSNSTTSVQNPVAQLLNNGNLIVRDQNDNSPDNFLWQSFDYPCDSLLPGMKLGRDRITGFDRFLTSWKTSEDPSPGSYTYRLDPHGFPQPFLINDHSVALFRDGPWNGVWFSGTATLPDDSLAQFVLNDNEMYYTYGMDVIQTRRTLNIDGTIQRLDWNNDTQHWSTAYTKPNDDCDSYASCGSFGICNRANSVHCECMEGFLPKSSIWSEGCIHNGQLNCSINNGFIKYSNVKLPDTRSSWYNTTMTLEECKNRCLNDCSCVAYANLDVTSGGSGCLLWFDGLMDVRVVNGPGQDLYIRTSSDSGGRKKEIWTAVGSSLAAFLILCGATIFVLRRKRRQERRRRKYIIRRIGEQNMSNNKKESELPLFAYDVIAEATNNFSPSNKLGKGGFGTVYKGVMDNGEEIAVKRLAKDSRQGLNEFKNEALFIARLQHRNLVRLIGCCVEAEERMLIYEYMPNNSLDRIIFDPMGSSILGWPKRFEIIKGIARGLLYLHEDSRLRIVHRDLKASNILLDSEMHPKISDFGMARSFDGNEQEAITSRVVGTYGYMPPEYTIDGLFSVKSDVYSFGVLVLEIISGKRNRGFKHSDHHHNLLGHVWKLFVDGKTLDVVESSIRNPSYEYEMQRLIHIGLLCVQQHPEDRPNMSLVNVMLNGDGTLPKPKEPGFYVGRNMPQYSVSSDIHSSSINEITITLDMCGR